MRGGVGERGRSAERNSCGANRPRQTTANPTPASSLNDDVTGRVPGDPSGRHRFAPSKRGLQASRSGDAGRRAATEGGPYDECDCEARPLWRPAERSLLRVRGHRAVSSTSSFEQLRRDGRVRDGGQHLRRPSAASCSPASSPPVHLARVGQSAGSSRPLFRRHLSLERAEILVQVRLLSTSSSARRASSGRRWSSRSPAPPSSLGGFWASAASVSAWVIASFISAATCLPACRTPRRWAACPARSSPSAGAATPAGRPCPSARWPAASVRSAFRAVPPRGGLVVAVTRVVRVPFGVACVARSPFFFLASSFSSAWRRSACDVCSQTDSGGRRREQHQRDEADDEDVFHGAARRLGRPGAGRLRRPSTAAGRVRPAAPGRPGPPPAATVSHCCWRRVRRASTSVATCTRSRRASVSRCSADCQIAFSADTICWPNRSDSS